jgi:spore coat protein CotF
MQSPKSLSPKNNKNPDVSSFKKKRIEEYIKNHKKNFNETLKQKKFEPDEPKYFNYH